MKTLLVIVAIFMGMQANAMESKVIKKGSFFTITPADPVSGDAEIIVDEKNEKYVVLKDNFVSSQGPFLYVVLHKDVVPKSYTKNNSVILSELVSFRGVQAYKIPKNVNLDAVNAVIIYCLEYDVTFGSAPLN